MFYGIKEDGVTAEFGVKEVIRRSDFLGLKFYLHFPPIRKIGIIRDVPILKAKRAEGSNVRGTRPITVCFEKFHVNIRLSPPRPFCKYFLCSACCSDPALAGVVVTTLPSSGITLHNY